MISHERLLIDAARKEVDAERPPLVSSRPDTIGEYRILREIGRGGMGLVYEAEQQNPKRRVALKVVRGVYADDHQVRLFRREAQALAMLRHPGIAAIHESGRTDAGEHFFAMELVQGAPLNEYIQANTPCGLERMQLFSRICDAVNYAHQRGVIHRDLKPANILVQADGTPKVLDFGLAKITDADGPAPTLVTEVGKIQGTLAYMSPEQANGNPHEVDVRSDVYALGVILYELLTGRLPYAVNSSRLPEAVHTICHEPPRRPSSSNRELKGDVETIVLTALAKEPDRRYQSAAALADDIRRCLADEPILARPSSALYQMRKFARRNRALVATAITVLLGLLFGTVGMGVGLSRATASAAEARRAEANADLEARKTAIINEVLQSLLAVPHGKNGGMTVSRKEHLMEIDRRIRREFSARPEVDAAIRNTIGVTFINMRRLEDARRHLMIAREICEEKLGESHPETLVTLINWAMYLRNAGRPAAAGEALAKAVETSKANWGSCGESTVSARYDLADLHVMEGEFAQCESILRQVVADCSDELGRDHQTTLDAVHRLARFLESGVRENVARNRVTSQSGRNLDEAEQLYRRALESQLETLGAIHPQTCQTMLHLALMLEMRGAGDEAEGLQRDLLKAQREILSPDDPVLHSAVAGMARFLVTRGKLDEAESLYREAVEGLLGLGMVERPERLRVLAELGDLCVRKGQFEEAEAIFLKGLAISHDIRGRYDAESLPWIEWIAKVRVETDRCNEAIDFVQARIRQITPRHGPRTHPMRSAQRILAKTLLDCGRTDEALEASEQSMIARRRKLMAPRAEADLLIVRGACLINAGRFEEAEAVLKNALGLPRPGPNRGEPHPVMTTLIDLYERWDKPAKAQHWRDRLEKAQLGLRAVSP